MPMPPLTMSSGAALSMPRTSGASAPALDLTQVPADCGLRPSERYTKGRRRGLPIQDRGTSIICHLGRAAAALRRGTWTRPGT